MHYPVPSSPLGKRRIDLLQGKAIDPVPRIMDTRSRDILLVLLSSPAPLTMEDIASCLRISPRMVRYSLGNIDAFLRSEKAILIRKPNHGLSVYAERQHRRALLSRILKLGGLPIVLSRTERFHRILHSLLFADEPILVKQLVPRLGVSRTTVLKDIDKVEVWLSKYDLSLIRRPNYGFQLISFERGWRESVVAALLDCASMPLSLLGKGTGDFCLSEIEREFGPFRVWRGFVEELELDLSERLISESQSILRRNYSDSSYVSLVLHLAVQIRRIRAGRLIGFSPELERQLEGSAEIDVARGIAKAAEQGGAPEFPEPEMAFIGAQLAGAKTNRPISALVGEIEMVNIHEEAEGLAKELAAAASLYLHPALCADDLLIRNLAYHLTSVLHRLKCGLPIENPLLNEIKRQFGSLYEIARRSSEVIERKVGRAVPDDEIGYLCMHLGAAAQRMRSMPKARVLVVCSQGVATSYLLVSSLEAEFSDIEVVDVVSVRRLSRMNAIRGDIDFIISTVPLEMKGVRVVVASPMLSAADKARIREEIDMKFSTAPSKRKKRDTIQSPLSELINSRTIIIGAHARDWQEVVDHAGHLLHQIGGIEERYIAAMKDVISDYGPYMVVLPGVVLLHAHPDQGVIRLCMSIVTLANSIHFGHPINDPVDIAVAIGAPDEHSHILALAQLMDILNDQEKLAVIRRATSTSVILDLVKTACAGE